MESATRAGDKASGPPKSVMLASRIPRELFADIEQERIARGVKRAVVVRERLAGEPRSGDTTTGRSRENAAQDGPKPRTGPSDNLRAEGSTDERARGLPPSLSTPQERPNASDTPLPTAAQLQNRTGLPKVVCQRMLDKGRVTVDAGAVLIDGKPA